MPAPYPHAFVPSPVGLAHSERRPVRRCPCCRDLVVRCAGEEVPLALEIDADEALRRVGLLDAAVAMLDLDALLADVLGGPEKGAY